jgi:hypothetical protein
MMMVFGSDLAVCLSERVKMINWDHDCIVSTCFCSNESCGLYLSVSARMEDEESSSSPLVICWMDLSPCFGRYRIDEEEMKRCQVKCVGKTREQEMCKNTKIETACLRQRERQTDS